MAKPTASSAERNRFGEVKTCHRTGLTLVETVLAMFVATILIAGILSSLVFSIRQFTEARAYTNATNIINQQVESLRALKFADINSTLGGVPANGSPITTPTTPLVLTVGKQQFRVTRSAKLVRNLAANAPNPNLIEMSVTVTWEMAGQPRSTSSSTYFSAYGFAAQS